MLEVGEVEIELRREVRRESAMGARLLRTDTAGHTTSQQDVVSCPERWRPH